MEFLELRCISQNLFYFSGKTHVELSKVITNIWQKPCQKKGLTRYKEIQPKKALKLQMIECNRHFLPKYEMYYLCSDRSLSLCSLFSLLLLSSDPKPPDRTPLRSSLAAATACEISSIAAFNFAYLNKKKITTRKF